MCLAVTATISATPIAARTLGDLTIGDTAWIDTRSGAHGEQVTVIGFTGSGVRVIRNGYKSTRRASTLAYPTADAWQRADRQRRYSVRAAAMLAVAASRRVG